MSAWVLEQVEGLTLARCSLLGGVPGIAHAFSTRRADARSDFDLGGADDRDPERERRRSRFLGAAGLPGSRPFPLRQVHGAAVVSAQHSWGGAPEADAVLWLGSSPARDVPSVRTADCVPILLVDRAGRGGAAVHAGWRGTAAGVVLQAVQALARAGIPPSDLLAAQGPAILACCYEVGPDVAAAVAAAAGTACLPSHAAAGGRVRLDLHAANRIQLERAGVRCASIEAAPWCTYCRPDLFFSHRREGVAAGRMLASIGPRCLTAWAP